MASIRMVLSIVSGAIPVCGIVELFGNPPAGSVQRFNPYEMPAGPLGGVSIIKKIFQLTFLLICPFLAIAEIIDGPANIRLHPQEETLLTLFDSVNVSCTELRNNWYQIGISIKITEQQYNLEFPIKTGDTLINRSEEVIGVAIMNIPNSVSYKWTSGGSKDNPKRFGMQIFGFTYKSNIRINSIPEIPLSKLINENITNLKWSTFSDFIKKFKFKETKILTRLYPQVDEYYIGENYIDDPSPMDRIRLIFIDQNLIAIVHTRDLKISNIVSHDLVRNRKLSIINLPPDVNKENFIEINIRAYDGID